MISKTSLGIKKTRETRPKIRTKALEEEDEEIEDFEGYLELETKSYTKCPFHSASHITDGNKCWCVEQASSEKIP